MLINSTYFICLLNSTYILLVYRDAFQLFNELDMLEVRLHELNETVCMDSCCELDVQCLRILSGTPQRTHINISYAHTHMLCLYLSVLPNLYYRLNLNPKT